MPMAILPNTVQSKLEYAPSYCVRPLPSVNCQQSMIRHRNCANTLHCRIKPSQSPIFIYVFFSRLFSPNYDVIIIERWFRRNTKDVFREGAHQQKNGYFIIFKWTKWKRLCEPILKKCRALLIFIKKKIRMKKKNIKLVAAWNVKYLDVRLSHVFLQAFVRWVCQMEAYDILKL